MAEEKQKHTLNWRRIFLRLLANKYFVILILAFLWLLIFSEDSLVNIRITQRHVEHLRGRVEHFRQQISLDSMRLQELHSSDASLEKFAREVYYMRAPNEDLFIVQ